MKDLVREKNRLDANIARAQRILDRVDAGSPEAVEANAVIATDTPASAAKAGEITAAEAVLAEKEAAAETHRAFIKAIVLARQEAAG